MPTPREQPIKNFRNKEDTLTNTLQKRTKIRGVFCTLDNLKSFLKHSGTFTDALPTPPKFSLTPCQHPVHRMFEIFSSGISKDVWVDSRFYSIYLFLLSRWSTSGRFDLLDARQVSSIVLRFYTPYSRTEKERGCNKFSTSSRTLLKSRSIFSRIPFPAPYITTRYNRPVTQCF